MRRSSKSLHSEHIRKGNYAIRQGGWIGVLPEYKRLMPGCNTALNHFGRLAEPTHLTSRAVGAGTRIMGSSCPTTTVPLSSRSCIIPAYNKKDRNKQGV